MVSIIRGYLRRIKKAKVCMKLLEFLEVKRNLLLSRRLNNKQNVGQDGGWAGVVVLRRWIHHPLPITLEVFFGMLVLLALRFLPVIGGTLWIVASLTALGTCVAVLALTTDVPQVDPSHP